LAVQLTRHRALRSVRVILLQQPGMRSGGRRRCAASAAASSCWVALGMTVEDSPEAILDFWFGDSVRSPDAVEARVALWFAANSEFDREIGNRFSSLPERALGGEFDAWLRRPASALALILVLDQFPRNLFRGSARAFGFDPKARETATLCVDAGFDDEIEPLQASFLYLPFEHSEEATDQQCSVALFEQLVRRAPPELNGTFQKFADYARRHRDVVQRLCPFGKHA
jgi:uncharacterized protein (DUF924 family)